MQSLHNIMTRHLRGERVGIYSVCSAHSLVLEAAIRLGVRHKTPVLIEATSNQVNQFGGYTGMQPADFSASVRALAERLGLPAEHLLLGGDHLGPNCWQNLPAEEAMRHSEQLIESYVAAGFGKIHLDCSFRCADDPEILDPQTMANRAARLCAVAEKTHQRVGGDVPLYVIGTEVPTPGGATEALEDSLAVTHSSDAATTLDIHQSAFAAAGLESVWPRVIALVVQPGVEFDHHRVIAYDADAAKDLKAYIEQVPGMVFEAHSTDYQPPKAYMELVQDHFAILKVGPALTFVLREALFALDHIEREWLTEAKASNLRATMEQIMLERPDYWQSYYHGTPHQIHLDRQYSLSDRIRYYWAQPEVEQAQQKMFANLQADPAPLTLLSQYLPSQFAAVQAGEIKADPRELVIHRVMEMLIPYHQACFQGES